jgi:superoxide dismutase, Fe-Mn family
MNTPERPDLSRRDALKIIGTGVVLAGLARPARTLAAEPPTALDWQLPPLGYAYAALEPQIDARTMEIHHTKHHQAYLTNAAKLLESHPELRALGPEAIMRDLSRVPETIRPGVRNNVGGHVNHAFFWRLLAPTGSAGGGRLAAAITEAFGPTEEFKKQFADAAMKRFGSGWAWLSAKPDGKLVVHSTANQDSPLSEGLTPVIGLDVWEHAYYLHYQNRRADYVAAFWKVLNWSQAEANYIAALKA